MQVDPKRLANHLERLHFRGTKNGIETVLLRDRFTCVARTMDSSLIVSAPGLEGVEPLPEEIGVDLRKLIGTLRLPMYRERDDKWKWVGIPTDLSLTPERLVLRGSDSTVKLHLVPPSTVESQVDPEVAEELFSQVPDDRPGVPLHVLPWFEEARQWVEEKGLPEELTKTVPAMAALLKARTVILKFGPQGGRFLIYGGGKSKSPGIDLAEIPHHLSAERDYSLNFDAQPLVSLLLKLGHVPRPCIHLSGPRGPVLFTTGDGFRYLLFPREARRTLRD